MLPAAARASLPVTLVVLQFPRRGWAFVRRADCASSSSWPLGGDGAAFAIQLDEFKRALHPGTTKAKEFSSFVTRIEGATVQRVHITMNEPMRHRGYTFYQSSWGPQDGRGPVWSQFSVVRNPSDRVPLIACVIIAMGLGLHFGRKLLLHLRAETRRGRIAAPALLVAFALGGWADAAAAAESAPMPPAWPEAITDRLATVPIQEGGRIMPLRAWSGYTLLRLNHRRSVKDSYGRRLEPLAWMLDVLLRPNVAKRTPCFLIQDAEVIEAVGLAVPEGKKKRDRYTYEELVPARARIRDLGMAYAHKGEKARTLVETYVMELSHDLQVFENLLGYLGFAVGDTGSIRVAPELRALFDDKARISVLEFLDHAPAVARAAREQGPAWGIQGHRASMRGSALLVAFGPLENGVRPCRPPRWVNWPARLSVAWAHDGTYKVSRHGSRDRSDPVRPVSQHDAGREAPAHRRARPHGGAGRLGGLAGAVSRFDGGGEPPAAPFAPGGPCDDDPAVWMGPRGEGSLKWSPTFSGCSCTSGIYSINSASATPSEARSRAGSTARFAPRTTSTS
jgi:hypothetical protein